MTLTELADIRMSEGSLPNIRRCRTYEGPSVGRSCALCHRSIPKDSTGIEVVCEAAERHTAPTSRFFVHVECCEAWARAASNDLEP